MPRATNSQEAFDDLKNELEAERDPIKVPDDLEAKVREQLGKQPQITWDHAMRLVIDPDYEDEDDGDDDEGEDEDDEDLSDVD